jgi:hypothetical protein
MFRFYIERSIEGGIAKILLQGDRAIDWKQDKQMRLSHALMQLTARRASSTPYSAHPFTSMVPITKIG